MEALWGIIQGMKPSSFEGPDGLSVKTIQTFFDGFGHIVLDLVNASLETGTVPASWKHATITPIPKGKLISSDPSSTRPISMLPAITKITERAVQLQLAEYMERHHLLSETQHGYRKSHSCETALHVVTDDILRAMDSGEIALWAMRRLSVLLLAASTITTHGLLTS
ncbi:putative RNA-directed DNA polymerase from transposon X-element [Amphibalanus amphitrite]|uniref:Putative RNA-directed DNA polymerase from transposon X-element n=1 Tax=Amphibalanus amphitrite TaxID=1232801 RepID=A0A6A4W8X2_AMPAM|nr:putative RNA-directed DNA polymerase from transposon X-element [Amphibalanus amphitrite]